MSQTAAANNTTERTAEKRTHSSEENGDNSNDAVAAKAQKVDNNDVNDVFYLYHSVFERFF